MFGVIDIGSNTIRLMIYEFDGQKAKMLLNKKYNAGLVSYINKNNLLTVDGITRCENCLLEIKHLLDFMRLDEVFVFATASLRNIDNGKEVADYLKDKTSFEIKILSDKEEAFYDYNGVIHSTNIKSGLLCDIGGGSTQLVLMNDGEVLKTCSCALGSLNAYEHYVKNLLPSPNEINEIVKKVKNELKSFPDIKTDTLVGIGGSARSAFRLYKHLFKHPEAQSLKAVSLRRIIKLIKENPNRLMDSVIKTCPERIHTIICGVIILNTICEIYDIKEILISSYGCREGYLYYQLERGNVYE